MKVAKIILFFTVAVFSLSAIASTHVHGYRRSNGTHIQPHHRSSPNHSRSDNWSHKGNTNPYTGKKGTKNN